MGLDCFVSSLLVLTLFEMIRFWELIDWSVDQFSVELASPV